MKQLITIFLLIIVFSCEAQISSPKKLLLSYYGDSTIIETSNLFCPTTLIADSSSAGFQMAHSLVTDGTYIYVGERISNTTPTEIARIIKYNASTLAEVGSYSVGANRDVESMVYNSGNNSSSGYISRELTINNNTAPTGAGITAKNSLTNKGWTVLTD